MPPTNFCSRKESVPILLAMHNRNRVVIKGAKIGVTVFMKVMAPKKITYCMCSMEKEKTKTVGLKAVTTVVSYSSIGKPIKWLFQPLSQFLLGKLGL